MFKVNELLKAAGGRLTGGAENLSVKRVCIDSRRVKKGDAFVAIKGNNFDGHDFIGEAIKKGAACIIGERILSGPKTRKAAFIQVKDTQKALGDMARIQRRKFNIPVIAVTGSNGKTTAKEMIAWVLSGRYNILRSEGTKNNQIGLPLTLLGLKAAHDIAVLEIGTNHFGEVRALSRIAAPNIGIITNIGPAHLQYFGSLMGVYREKTTLLENLENPCVAVLNADDELLQREIRKKTKRPFILGFGIQKKCDFFAGEIKNRDGEIKFLCNKHKFSLKTLGYQNIYNALIAITVGRLFGMENREIALRLSSFDFPQHRLNLKRLNRVYFIDDTYNSNPFSLKQALDALANFGNKGRKIFVMGDMLELGEKTEYFHYQAGRQAGRICDAFIGVGKFSRLAGCAAAASGLDSANIFNCLSSRQARDILFKQISPDENDVILVKGSRAMRMEDVI